MTRYSMALRKFSAAEKKRLEDEFQEFAERERDAIRASQPVEYRDPDAHYPADSGTMVCNRCGEDVFTDNDGWICRCDSAMFEYAKPAASQPSLGQALDRLFTEARDQLTAQAAWREAHGGDTPGSLIPGEGDAASEPDAKEATSASDPEKLERLIRHVVQDRRATTPEPALTVHKAQQWMPVTCCLMTDATGQNHCEHEPWTAPPQSRWSRMRTAFYRHRANLGRRMGSLIAGEPLHLIGECDEE